MFRFFLDNNNNNERFISASSPPQPTARSAQSIRAPPVDASRPQPSPTLRADAHPTRYVTETDSSRIMHARPNPNRGESEERLIDNRSTCLDSTLAGMGDVNS